MPVITTKTLLVNLFNIICQWRISGSVLYMCLFSHVIHRRSDLCGEEEDISPHRLQWKHINISLHGDEWERRMHVWGWEWFDQGWPRFTSIVRSICKSHYEVQTVKEAILRPDSVHLLQGRPKKKLWKYMIYSRYLCVFVRVKGSCLLSPFSRLAGSQAHSIQLSFHLL